MSWSILQTLFGLVLVLGAIAACAWLARRAGVANPRGALPLKLVSSLAVGARERVVVVEIEGQWMVLGVAPGRVSALGTLPKGELPQAPSSSGPAFAALLEKVTRRAPR